MKNISQFVSSDRKSFPYSKASTYISTPFIFSNVNDDNILFLYIIKRLQNSKKCSAFSFGYPHLQFGFEIIQVFFQCATVISYPGVYLLPHEKCVDFCHILKIDLTNFLLKMS
jgi:hypothetical protein